MKLRYSHERYKAPTRVGMQGMARIGPPNTFLAVDVVRKGRWPAEGVPITVKKVVP